MCVSNFDLLSDDIKILNISRSIEEGQTHRDFVCNALCVSLLAFWQNLDRTQWAELAAPNYREGNSQKGKWSKLLILNQSALK